MFEELKNSRKIIASIEARMGSTRLPGKVLMEAAGKPLLQVMAERVEMSKLIDEVVIATTVNPNDDRIAELCKKMKIKYFRGSEDDVLGRVYSLHKKFSSDIVVSLCGDCPLIDADIMDQGIITYLTNQPCDYVTNAVPRSYPLGMNFNVYPFSVLKAANIKGKTDDDREHTTHFFRSDPKGFKHIYLTAPPSLYFPELEVVLDEQDDYELIKFIYESLYPKKNNFNCGDIINFVKNNPRVLEINDSVKRK